MKTTLNSSFVALIATVTLASIAVDAGVIKDLFQKLTNTNEKAEGSSVVKESSPICGNGLFASPNEKSLSPEFIFITNRPSSSQLVNQGGNNNNYGYSERNVRRESDEKTVAKEFRFHAENVTLQELERNGFNPNGPVSFIMHGFTSGYPLQAWMAAIVESYTIDRESDSKHQGNNNNNNNNGRNDRPYNYQQGGQSGNYNPQTQSSAYGYDNYNYQNQNQNQYGRNRRDAYDDYGFGYDSNGKKVNHNLFIINWNYAARGILYPRAVANIPIVATYATRFINEKLLGEARVDPYHIQLIGHSLGAHLAGFIGKNTRSKIGRIYGLDPAGPCFGTISGSLYPASKRLAPTDAEEVITIQTNSALLGIDKPLGRYSVFVEGGATQPGCKGGGVLKSISGFTFDGDDFDDIACSHSRAPNLLTYRFDDNKKQESCQLVAYECKSWDAFIKGRCGVCRGPENYRGAGQVSSDDPYQPVECIRIGLDWQYSKKSGSNNQGGNNNYQRPTTNSDYSSNSNSNYDNDRTPTKRPNYGSSSSQYDNDDNYGNNNNNNNNGRNPIRQPNNSGSGSSQYDNNDNNYNNQNDRSTTSRRPNIGSNSQYENNNGYSTSRRPVGGNQYNDDDTVTIDGSRPYDSSNPSRRPTSGSSGSQYDNVASNGRNPTRQPNYGSNSQYENNNYGNLNNGRNPTRRPSYSNTSSLYDQENYGNYQSSADDRRPNRRPNQGVSSYSNSDNYNQGSNYDPYESDSNGYQRSPYRRNKRAASDRQPRQNEDVQAISMYLRSVDTQPYCTFHYQVILELQEPFPKNKRPPIGIVIQDSEPEQAGRGRKEQNTLSNDNFGEKYNDKIYTHLITSVKKIKRPDHATLIFREGLPNGHRILKSLTVNYMSHIDPEVRRQFSTRLCLVKKNVNSNEDKEIAAGNRFFFEPCDGTSSSNSRPNINSGSQSGPNGQYKPNTSGQSNDYRPNSSGSSNDYNRPNSAGYSNDYRPNSSGSSNNDYRPNSSFGNNQGNNFNNRPTTGNSNNFRPNNNNGQSGNFNNRPSSNGYSNDYRPFNG